MIREKIWDCGSCDTTGILGRYKECPSCGNPREKGEMQMHSQKSISPLSEDLVKMALSGADWFCGNCNSGNIGTSDRCVKCGSPRKGIAEEDHPDFTGDHQSAPVIPNDGAGNVEEAVSTPPIPLSIPPVIPPIPPIPPDRGVEEIPYPSAPSSFPYAFLLVPILFLVGYGVYWSFSSYEVMATLEKMEWKYEVKVDQWVPEQVHQFQKETRELAMVPPVNGKGEQPGMQLVGNTCQSEHHHYRKYTCRGNSCCDAGDRETCEDVYRNETEKYSCTKTVHKQVADGETCRDLGNGFEDCKTKYKTVTSEVPDTCTRTKKVYDHRECDCSESIKEIACDYIRYTWKETKTLPTSGTSLEVKYAEYTPAELERIRKTEWYQITLSYPYENGVEEYKENPRTYLEYAAWADQSEYKVTLYNMGMVREVEHPSIGVSK